MLIVCPKCFTQYLISDEITLSKSQKFHCSTCHNYFTQETENVKETTDRKTVVETDSMIEAIKSNLDDSVKSQKDFDSMVSSDNLTESKPESEEDNSLFSQSLDSIENEQSLKENRLDSIPEEFKPVTSSPKGSLWVVFVWLLIVFGVCAGIYYQKDFLINQIDILILGQLDTGSKNVSKTSVLSKSDQVGNVKMDTEASVNVDSSFTPVANNQEVMSEKGLLSVNTSESSETEKNQNLPISGNGLDGSFSNEIFVKGLNSEVTESTSVIQLDVNVDEDAQTTEPMALNQTNTGIPDVNLQKTLDHRDSNLKNILKIQEVFYEITPNEVGIERLAIQGEIANTELQEVTLPECKAIVYDEQDNVVARKRIILSQSKLDGNSTLSFSTAVVPAPKTVSRIEVVFDE